MDRLTHLITCFTGGLRNLLAFALPRSPVPAPLASQLVKRVFRMRNRFLALLAQFRAGTLPPPPAPRPSRAGLARTASTPCHPEIAPRRVAAMLHPIKEAAWTCRCFLAHIIDDPQEAQALVAAAPQAGRILRTFARMVGIKPRPWLALPPRPRKPRVRKPRPRSAKRRPLGRLAYGKLIHPDRPGQPALHPPNHIGYGRAKPFPRDYRPPSKND